MNAILQELYNINDDPKRVEFLDDYSLFLKRKGTAITRLPVMSKQVLDLYELYRLVCENGGVLEVIKNKTWQDVIRKLRLPSSNTSAAFTLRSQYIKYLYPYECEKRNFSTPRDLDAFVEFNKREKEPTPAYSPVIGSNYPFLQSIYNGFDQSALASLIARQNLMLQYMQVMETPPRNVEDKLGGTEIEAPRIKREREDDDESDIPSKKSLLYNLLTPSNTSYEEERSISEHSMELNKPVDQTKNSDELSMLTGMQFNVKKDENGQLVVNLKLNGNTYEGNIFKVK